MTQQIMIDELVTQSQSISWLPWAVQYFFFIGIAACGALFACSLRWRGDTHSTQLEHITLIITLTCAITAPLALTADLHQPARVWHFYAYPTPWSWMPWGAVFLPLFTLLLGLWFIAVQYNTQTGKSFAATRWLALFSALAAIGLLIYTGREASVLKARPIWFSYAFPLTMFLSALQTLFALLIFAMRQDDRWRRRLGRAQLLSLLILAGTVTIWATGDTVSGNAVRLWLTNSASARLYAGAWGALWLCTTLLALAVSLRARATHILLCGACSAMALAWLIRWTLLIEVQTVPKYNAHLTPYTLPSTTDGLQALIGTFGLWVALLIMVREALGWLARRKQHG